MAGYGFNPLGVGDTAPVSEARAAVGLTLKVGGVCDGFGAARSLALLVSGYRVLAVEALTRSHQSLRCSGFC
ncbi:hypothetical protein Pfra02_06850 [Pseudomonas fragi]|nr:hypothetical protein Pfra02_06850 [Pseudomonas fragi]